MPKKVTTQGFIDRARKVHGNRYDYSLVEYKRHNEKVKIICPIHGVFEQTPDAHTRGEGCPRVDVVTQEKMSAMKFELDKLIRETKEKF